MLLLQTNLNWLTALRLDAFFYQRPQPLTEVPYSVRAVRDSMIQSSPQGWVFWLIISTVLLTIVLMTIYAWRRESKNPSKKISNNPDTLYESVLAQLDLSDSQKNLLRKMSRGARLRHPIISLLSPGLLDWSRRLWVKEQGSRQVEPNVTRLINEISVRLYDHQPPSINAHPAGNTHKKVTAPV